MVLCVVLRGSVCSTTWCCGVRTEYSRVTLTYWMMLYRAMNLKTQKDVMRAARPSLGTNQKVETNHLDQEVLMKM